MNINNGNELSLIKNENINKEQYITSSEIN